MKSYQCKNCGAELVKTDNGYTCQYCKQIYTEDSLEQAYQKICQTLQSTVQGVVNEELLREKLERIAYCRQELYKTCMGEYVNSEDVGYWAKQILKQNPEDVQANFFLIASTERWIELNKFLSNFNVQEYAYLLKGFVRYLTNGRFVEKCVLRLNDLISKAFEENSEEYKSCHKMILDATENAESGIFDSSLPRDVFVAYSSKDSQKAYEIVEYLEERGLNCFISMRNLPKGVNAERYYEERLKQAIDNCQVFLFVSSKNSRSRSCDAYRLEIAYVKENDLKKSEDANYYNANYDLYFEKYRNKCKPRIEWLIENYGNSIYETEVKKFFKGLSWCVEEESVLKAASDYITNSPISKQEKATDEFARQKAEFERQKAEIERQKVEFAKQQAEAARLRQAELAKEKAESARQKAEYEKQIAQLKQEKATAQATPQSSSYSFSFEKPKTYVSPSKAPEKPVSKPPVYSEPKKDTTALFLCLFFGIWGAHKFYEGKIKTGLLYVFTFGGFYIGWIRDIIKYLKK